MKILHQIVLLATFLFYGCIKEDFRECSKMQGVLIKFRYEEAGMDVCGKTISGVHLFVFNQEDGEFVLSKQINQAALNKLQGAALYLPEGNYQIVCWGNAYENSEFCTLSKISHLNDRMETYILNAKTNSVSGYVEDGDKLYYAPYLDSKSFCITVPASPETEYTMDFRTAHTTIEVYATGFTDLSDQATNLSPNIELTNLTPKYDFKLNEFGEPITYRQTTCKKNIQGLETEVAIFNTPLFERNRDIKIVLRKQSTNQILETINLEEFIDEHYSHVDFLSPGTVNLKIEFKYVNGKTTISIPTWKDDTISPEI